MAADETEGRSLERLFREAVARTWTASDESWPGFEFLALSSAGAQPASARRAATAVAARPHTAAPHNPDPAATAAADASDAAIAAVAAAARAARAAGVVSANETLEDVSTRALRFVLLPFLAAAAHAAWQGPPTAREARLAHLEAAKAELRELFRAVDALGLLTQIDRDRVLDDMPELVETPQQRRDALIDGHRKEKAAADKLKALLARRKAHGENADGDDNDDEELEREAILTMIESAVRRGIGSITSIDREVEILRYALASEANGEDPAARAGQDRPSGPPPGLNGMPSTFRIVNERGKARQHVFRPDHSIPTYTVEEWGEFEMQRLAQATREKKERDTVKAKAAAEEDSDGDDVSNRETYKKRSWDNWKDNHNKGSGNSLR